MVQRWLSSCDHVAPCNSRSGILHYTFCIATKFVCCKDADDLYVLNFFWHFGIVIFRIVLFTIRCLVLLLRFSVAGTCFCVHVNTCLLLTRLIFSTRGNPRKTRMQATLPLQHPTSFYLKIGAPGLANKREMASIKIERLTTHHSSEMLQVMCLTLKFNLHTPALPLNFFFLI